MCKSRNKNVEDHKKRGKPHVKMVESRAKRCITHSKMRTLGFVPFLMYRRNRRKKENLQRAEKGERGAKEQ
jgi:hypothetical protein